MNNIVLRIILSFIGLVLLQVLVCSNINFLGEINPYVYVIFIILYPVTNNRLLFIFLSFFIGYTVDIFLDSGGVHAAASVAIAYIRPLFLKFSFGAAYDYQSIKFSNIDFSRRLIYFLLLIVIHHLILFSLVVFDKTKAVLILQQTVYSSSFTLILSLLFSSLFSRKET
ncbi:MAG: rod shape-determining protein MreD [Flavobacteriaceae bacterium]|jgi:rod shape-determining protein MreD|nr:rod shape-determining protein MreD [Flavobacteriaceae bacterium]MDA7848790.1 rod shape-determining protein MreD [Flavobacteriaceae bacterium]MDB0004091.1 rod shape-determining protein MreD [Flavobacteriaceae bacterium]MDG1309763.1 rod shape-determining protein MreD [Flavobacteriaceae bacterium]|tara:strand:- start:24526 stop:25032 length:507 start_codon:yes stop_codon:yes gene_type:complete